MDGKEVYLGDGLYVSIEGPYVKLRAPRADGDHEVYLESEVLQELLNFLKFKGIYNDRYDEGVTDGQGTQ